MPAGVGFAGRENLNDSSGRKAFVKGLCFVIFMMVTLQGCEHLDVYSVEGYRPIILSPDHAPAPMLDRTYAFVCEKDQEHYTMFPAGGMKGPWYRLDYEGEIIEMSPEEIQAFLDRQPEGIQFKPIYKTPF